MALSPGQQQDAQHIYSFAVSKGLPPARAKEIALAAFHEGGLDPAAQGVPVASYGGQRAQGDMQLLSPGYIAKAKALGGVNNTEANVGAILPDYQKYWQTHPDAPVGAAAAAVERSGKGADYYGADGNLLSFLGSVGGDITAGPAPAQPMQPAQPLGGPSMDARKQFALTIAQNIGSHNHDPAAFADAVTQLRSAAGADTAPVDHAPAGYAAAGGDSSIVAKVASNYLGTPYKWGGSTLKGMDCSAFVQNVFQQLGVKLPRTTYDQVKHGQPVGLHELAPGDAIFTEPGHAGPNHVGLYVGNGMVQESPHTGDVNKLIPLDDFLSGGFVAARRYLPTA